MTNFMDLSILDFRNPQIVYVLIPIYFGIFLFLYKLSDHFWYKLKADKIITSNVVKVNFLLRVVSQVHAVVSTSAALWVLYYDKDLYQNPLLYKSYGICLTLSLVMGYLCYDFFMMMIFKEAREASALTHHLISTIAFLACARNGVFPLIAIIRLTSEFSTPFVNNRWFMVTLNYKTSKFYFYNGIMMLISFGLCRILPIMPLWIQFYSMTQTDLWPQISLLDKSICVFSSVPLDILNIYWFYKIFKGCVKARKELKSA